ncbi:MAG: hypothetical protein FWE04_00925 [Oscillospiraceae bacterium]|nr:hypothetical protein [Oscillospiraceae bacterium]
MKKIEKCVNILRFVKFALVISAFLLTIVTTVFADDPLTTIGNMSNFIFAAIRAIGVIILAWGVVQIGLSLQSHDPSQRTNGFLTFFGGLVIALSREILGLIGIM